MYNKSYDNLARRGEKAATLAALVVPSRESAQESSAMATDKNWKLFDFVKDTPQPPVKIPLAFFHQTYISHECSNFNIDISQSDVRLTISDLKRALRNPERLIASLSEVCEKADSLYTGDPVDSPVRHSVARGLVAFTDSNIVRGGFRDKCITVFDHHIVMGDNVVTNCSHYIEIGAHLEQMAARDNLLGESVSGLIKEQISIEVGKSLSVAKKQTVAIENQLLRLGDEERRIKRQRRIAERKIVRAKEIEERKKSKQPRTTDGYVYLLQSDTGHYKIGRTVDPDNRMRTFNVKLPFEVDYICTIPTPDMYALESELHDRFAAKRVNGEWFDLSAADVAYIKGMSDG